jgi:hypothetical protein
MCFYQSEPIIWFKESAFISHNTKHLNEMIRIPFSEHNKVKSTVVWGNKVYASGEIISMNCQLGIINSPECA